MNDFICNDTKRKFLMCDFLSWSFKHTFTDASYPFELECNYCKKPRVGAHLCVHEGNEIIKIHRCPRKDLDVYNNIDYKNFVCSSCFIYTYPEKMFKRKCKEAFLILAKYMRDFDAFFVEMFIDHLWCFLLSDVLCCVRCSRDMRDYRLMTYRHYSYEFCKQRLEK